MSTQQLEQKTIRRPRGWIVRLFVATLLALSPAGCGSDPESDDSPPSAADPDSTSIVARARELAELFESEEPYSRSIVDSTDLRDFFTARPEYVGDSAAITSFYERRDMQFAWVLDDSLSASAEAFIAMTGSADQTGGDASLSSLMPTPGLESLHAALYDPTADLGERIAVCEGCDTDVELRLTAEFFRFTERNFNGYLSRDLADLGWFIPRAKKDRTRLLDSLAVGTLDLSAYEPRHPQYRRLKSRLPAFRELSAEPWPDLGLPEGARTLEAGDSAAVVRAVRLRLALLGDLETADQSERVDSAVVAAVQRFQRRHGLTVDGVIGPNTLAAMNVPPAERIRTMLVNMERLRWMPDERPDNLIFVNIPEFRLHVYEGGEEVMGMDVVVGTHASRTVVFADSVSQVVFSPTWTVPQSIARNEILPQLERDPRYLEDRNMEVVGGTDDLPVFRQRPGPGNALGQVKFMFPNSYSIYMHDTPSQSLFGEARRAFSHGCIRLSRPRDLAVYLLRHDPAWTRDRIDRAMGSGVETYVSLEQPVPVMIAYFTAWVDDAGVLQFRDDVYSHDARLASELFSE